MTRPEYTEKIIYLIVDQENYFFKKKKKHLRITINEFFNLSTWDLNLNEFLKNQDFLESKHKPFFFQDRLFLWFKT